MLGARSARHAAIEALVSAHTVDGDMGRASAVSPVRYATDVPRAESLVSILQADSFARTQPEMTP
jgi:hypothetical protein